MVPLEFDTRFLRRGGSGSGGGSGSCIITTLSLPNGTDGTPYSQTIVADAVATFAVIAGALPDGLTLDPGGTITGTPTLANPYDFTVQATTLGGGTCTRDLSITILPNEPPEFEPPQLADLIVWNKRETLSGLSDNDDVDPWPDSSPAGNDMVSPGGGFTPTWNAAEQGVEFDGSDRLQVATPGTTSTVYTTFVVVKFASATGSEGVSRVGNDTGGYGFLKLSGNRSVIHRAVASCDDGPATTDKEVWSAVRSEGPNSIRFFVNGVEQVVTNSGSNVNTPDDVMLLGDFSTTSPVPLTGFIYENATYQIALSNPDRQLWETYLMDKHLP